MLVYIMYMDAYASTYGIGGQVNRAMYKVLRAHKPNFVMAEAFDRLYQYSNGLYRVVWGESYPKEEMLSDVVNKDVFTLITSAVFLRHLVAEISTVEGDAAREQLALVQATADHLADKYPEILMIAAEMPPQAEAPEMVTLHIEMFTPVFYISLLELHQLRHKLYPDELTDDEANSTTEAYISIIMNLAQLSYKHVGIESMHLITHPLLRVALYTRIEAHRNWVVARFKEMVGFGPYIARAYAFLLWAIKKETESGEKVDIRKEFQSPHLERFMV
ncbi:hypothetical protein NQ176_g7917 [Zarea fungicola]|uniref:Uncharacterized protein n=1 Tax=Zarea fungicola TaxID=93591 RepID=A0ACC1MXM0_9HYPO|nr:hypothetical protein NQ176_g7917 [Lecanicillium fungicola]